MMVKSGDAMRGVPALFLRDWGADSPWWVTAQVGRWLALRLQFRKVGGRRVLPDGWAKARGANRGMAEVVGEVGGDILPERAVPDGEAMEFRGVATYSGGIARRGGREESR